MALKLGIDKLGGHITIRFLSTDEINGYDKSARAYAEAGWLFHNRVQLSKHVYALIYVNMDSWLCGKLFDIDVVPSKKGYVFTIQFDDEAMETEFVLKCL